MEWLRTPLVSAEDAAAAAAARSKPKVSAAHRLLQLDMVRGLIMAIMAWDHSRDMISDRTLPVNQGSEMWSGGLATYDNNIFLMFQRWLPHFCAPGFFFLMGIGMAFFHTSRMKQFTSGAWSNQRIVKHFFIRGVLLILMDRIVNIPFYVTEVSPSHWYGGFNLPGSKSLRGILSIFEVLTALGLSMILCGLLLPVFAWVSKRVRYMRDGVIIITGGQILAILLGVISYAVSNAVIVHYQDGDPYAVLPWPRAAANAETFSDYLVRFTVIPGIYPQGDVSYPIFPWISLCLWGIATGYFFVSPLGRPLIANFALIQGCVCWFLFLLIRTFGGTFGNLRGWPRNEPAGRQENFLIAFLTVCKYPPSLAYALLTLGGFGFATLGLDRLVWHFSRVSHAREAAWNKAQWNAGLIRVRSGVTNSYGQAGPLVAGSISERDFPPLVISGAGSVAPAPAASNGQPEITVQVVRPSMGDEKDLQKIAQAKEAQSSAHELGGRSTGCCGAATLNEFQFWPWYGRIFFFPLLTFGRVPLFFYVVHWYVLALGSLFFHAVGNGLWMPYVVIWWASLLVLMFFLCAPYAKFKDRQGQESLWRFL